MGTFLPFLYHYLGQGDSKHMVATIVVYFHPARSAGSMIEAVVLGTIAFLYAVFISIASMAVSVVCETQFELIELGYVLVLVVFVGGGLGLVGWIKQRLGSPLVNVACSLASLAIITVLTKENAVQTAVFSNDKIMQVMKMLIMGIVTTTAVNLLIWPVSSRQDLRHSMIGTTSAISDLLTTITSSFLKGSDDELKSAAFQIATKRYISEFAALTKNLREAKMEHYVLGTEDQYHVEAKIVNCMQRLAQDIGGLRSAATTQFALLQEPVQEPVVNGSTAPLSPRRLPTMPSYGSIISTVKAKQERSNALTAIEEASEESSEIDDSSLLGNSRRRGTMDSEMLDLSIRTPAEIFARFMRHLGPSMKSLALTLHQILEELPFGRGPEFKITINENFLLSLNDALELYRNSRAEALAHLYRTKNLGRERVESVEADFEEVAASCGHYSFCLQDFAEAIQKYLEILEELKLEIEQPQRKSWRWLKFWRTKDQPEPDSSAEDTLQSAPDMVSTEDLPKVKLRKPDLQLTPKQSLWRRLYKALAVLQREDIRYAIKVGVGAALWAMFAFIPATRPIYAHWRGEWGFLSYMLVCSMTTGGGNSTAIARFNGTFIGAILAVFVWLSCQGNPYALCVCGWLVSLFCFYLIVSGGRAPFGRFILLTYNISALYAYSLSAHQGADDDDEGGPNPIISEIALHRLVAVTGGCLWGLFITNIIWPSSARSRFQHGLASLWLRMGLIWKRDPLSCIQSGDARGSQLNLNEEFALQSYALRLDGLRAAAASEFELRGPFRGAEWARVMGCTHRMLDAFHAVNVVIAQNLVGSPGELALLKYTEQERREVCGRICHLFQVLASSLMLEYPVGSDNAMPSLASPRDRLLSKIFQFRKGEASLVEGAKGRDGEDENGTVAMGGMAKEGPDAGERIQEGVAKDEDYALLYAYALVTGQLAEEIEKLEKEIKGLFGVLDDSRW